MINYQPKHIYIYMYLEPKWPLFLKVNPPKQGLFQSKPGSFGFQVYIYISDKIPQTYPNIASTLIRTETFFFCCGNYFSLGEKNTSQPGRNRFSPKHLCARILGIARLAGTTRSPGQWKPIVSGVLSFGEKSLRRKMRNSRDFSGKKQFEDWVGVRWFSTIMKKTKAFFVTYNKRWFFLAKEFEQNASTVFW